MVRSYDDYVNYMQQIADINYSIAVLQWDKEVFLPKAGAAMRTRQVSTLRGISHEKFTDGEFGGALERLAGDASLDDRQRKNVQRSLQDYEKMTCFEKEFVIEISRSVSEAYHTWLQARQENEFDIYIPSLTKLVGLVREEAEKLGYENHPYDALLDFYDKGIDTTQLDGIFRDVRSRLVPMVEAIRNREQVDDSFLYGRYPEDKQWAYGLDMLKKLHFDFDKGRQDKSPHPFTIEFSSDDVRITTRVDERNLAYMLWSSIHECGHALYESGLPIEQYGLPLGAAASVSIHESQARMWENHVARSLPFWEYHYPSLQKLYPDNLANVGLKHFYRSINRVEPNYIRTEADELHYHFHVLIRYELEKELLAGKIEVPELRDKWNEKYKAYFGLEAPDDLRGVLQDVHWSHGSFGYFPTYSLGSFYAAQFYARITSDVDDLEGKMAAGDTDELLAWLRENIHAHGRYYTSNELCRKVTGEPLALDFFLDYARRKFGDIYSVDL